MNTASRSSGGSVESEWHVIWEVVKLLDEWIKRKLTDLVEGLNGDVLAFGLLAKREQWQYENCEKYHYVH